MSVAASHGGIGQIADSIAGLLRAHGLRPNHECIAQLVLEHKHAFIEQLLSECGVQAAADSGLLAHVRTMEDLTAIEVVVRTHAALIEKLGQELQTDEVTT